MRIGLDITQAVKSRGRGIARYIREVMLAPDVLAIQEAENLTALQDLADRKTYGKVVVRR